MNTKDTKELRLVELWNRRATLNEQEWYELYVLVKKALSYKCLSIIEDLRVDPEDCIQDFFEDKVFALSQHKHKIDHAGVVLVYYERYLISRQRNSYVKLTVPLVMPNEDDEENRYPNIDDLVAPESPHYNLLKFDANIETDSVGASESSNLGSIETDSIDASDSVSLKDHECFSFEVDYDILNDGKYADDDRLGVDNLSLHQGELNIDIEKIQKSAIDFLYGKGEWSHLENHREWIQLYLKCHFCPDKEVQEFTPLYKLAKKHHIPSYHTRAVKLGITGPKNNGEDTVLESFRLSYLGQWLASVGIPVDPEHQAEMALALKILCLEALKLQRPC